MMYSASDIVPSALIMPLYVNVERIVKDHCARKPHTQQAVQLLLTALLNRRQHGIAYGLNLLTEVLRVSDERSSILVNGTDTEAADQVLDIAARLERLPNRQFSSDDRELYHLA